MDDARRDAAGAYSNMMIIVHVPKLTKQNLKSFLSPRLVCGRISSGWSRPFSTTPNAVSKSWSCARRS